jgi:hypothetical protein
MKRLAVFLLVAVFTMAVMAVPALAAPGGMPAAHGVDGKTFGGLASGLAKSYPGAVADHLGAGASGGAPGLHGVDGKTFGELTSGLAKLYPGAVADHIAEYK